MCISSQPGLLDLNFHYRRIALLIKVDGGISIRNAELNKIC